MSLTDLELQSVIELIDERWNADQGRRDRWASWAKQYEGFYWSEASGVGAGVDGDGVESEEDDFSALDQFESPITSNKGFEVISQLEHLVTDNSPVVTVSAREPVFQSVASAWQKWWKYFWDVSDAQNELRKAWKNALLKENGVIQVSYDSEENRVKIESVDPEHLVFQDGKHSDLRNCSWVCKRRGYSVADVRRRFPDHADMIVSDARDGGSTASMSSWDSNNNTCTVYELWMLDDTVLEDDLKDGDAEQPDLKKRGKRKLKYPNGRYLVFTNAGRDGKPVMLEDKPSPFEHGFPPWVVVYDWRPPSGNVWGIGEMRLIETLEAELNMTLQGMSRKVQDFLKQNFAVDTDKINIDEVREKFSLGGQFFELVKGADNPENRDGDTGIYPITTVGPSEQEHKYVEMLDQRIDRITGITDIQRGQSIRKERVTEFEVSALLEGGGSKTRLRVSDFEKSVKDIAELVMHVSQQYGTNPMPYREDLPNGGSAWGEVSSRRGDIQRIVAKGVDDQWDAMEEAQTEESPPPMLWGSDTREGAKRTALERLQAVLPSGGDDDPMLLRFKIDVVPTSTLPQDQQSRAQIVMQAYDRGAMSKLTMLEALHIPNPEQELQRLWEEKRQEAEAMGGGQQAQAAQGPQGMTQGYAGVQGARAGGQGNAGTAFGQ